MKKAIGNLEDGERLFEGCGRALQPIPQVRAFTGDLIDQSVPALADFLETPPPHHETEVGDASFDQLQPGIALLEQDDLDSALEGSACRLRQAVMHLEADQIVDR